MHCEDKVFYLLDSNDLLVNAEELKLQERKVRLRQG